MIDKQTLLGILNGRKEVLTSNNDIFREPIIEELDFLIKRIEEGFFDIENADIKNDVDISFKDCGLYESNITTLFAFVHSNGEREGLLGSNLIIKSETGSPLILANSENHVLQKFKEAAQKAAEVTGETIKIVTFEKVSEEILYKGKK